MEEKKCFACGSAYYPISGHSCGDTHTTCEVRRLLALEITRRRKLEDGINALDEVLTPIAHHFASTYNSWRRNNPKTISLITAGKHLIEYVQARQNLNKKF